MRVPGTPYAAPFSQGFLAEASKDESCWGWVGKERGGCLLRSRPLLGATWATWPGRECRKRANLNRWEDNDERQKIPRTTSHRTPSHPIPPHPIQSRLSVAARSRRAGAPRGSGRPLGCTTGSWSSLRGIDKPGPTSRRRPTQPDLPNPTPPPATSSCGTPGIGSNVSVGPASATSPPPPPPTTRPACRDRGKEATGTQGGWHLTGPFRTQLREARLPDGAGRTSSNLPQRPPSNLPPSTPACISGI